MEKKKLDEILEKHRKWVMNEDGGERADLCYANLSSADLRNAELSYANNLDKALMYNLQCPEEGPFIGWKKCRDNVIVKIKITDDSLRSSATSRKCRASKVEVLEIFGADKAESKHESGFIYEVGSVLEISDFDANRWEGCSTGIHFFITRKEAENY